MGSRLNKNSVDSIVFDSTLRLIIIGRCQKKILEGVPMSFKKSSKALKDSLKKKNPSTILNQQTPFTSRKSNKTKQDIHFV